MCLRLWTSVEQNFKASYFIQPFLNVSCYFVAVILSIWCHFLWPPQQHTPTVSQPGSFGWQKSKSLSCSRHFASLALGPPAVKQQLSASLSDSHSSEWKTMDLVQGVCILFVRACVRAVPHTNIFLSSVSIQWTIWLNIPSFSLNSAIYISICYIFSRLFSITFYLRNPTYLKHSSS